MAEGTPENKSIANETDPAAMTEFRYYKVVDGKLYYHEAWIQQYSVMEHWGRYGEIGKNKSHPATTFNPSVKIFKQLELSARENGFEPVELSDYGTLIIEYSHNEEGIAYDLIFRQRAENFVEMLTSLFALGYINRVGGGTLSTNVHCFILDFQVAELTLRTELYNSEFRHYDRIYLGS